MPFNTRCQTRQLKNLKKKKHIQKGFISGRNTQNDCRLGANIKQRATSSVRWVGCIMDRLSPLSWTLWWRGPLTWTWAWRGPGVDGSSSPLRSVSYLKFNSHQISPYTVTARQPETPPRCTRAIIKFTRLITHEQNVSVWLSSNLAKLYFEFALLRPESKKSYMFLCSSNCYIKGITQTS